MVLTLWELSHEPDSTPLNVTIVVDGAGLLNSAAWRPDAPDLANSPRRPVTRPLSIGRTWCPSRPDLNLSTVRDTVLLSEGPEPFLVGVA